MNATFLDAVMWAAMGVGALSVLAALVDRIGLSAVLILVSLGTAVAVCLVEGSLVWALLLGTVMVSVPVLYRRHVVTRRREQVEAIRRGWTDGTR